jgi:hypothetical protein
LRRNRKVSLRRTKRVLNINAEYKINIDENCEFDSRKVEYNKSADDIWCKYYVDW